MFTRRAAGLLVLLGAVAFAAPTPARADEPPRRHGLWAEIDQGRHQVFARLGGQRDWYWDHGPRYEALRGNLTFHAGAELQADVAWFADVDDSVEAAAGGTWESGFNLRRARLILEGTIHKYWYWRVRYDLAPDNFAKFQDFYGEWSGLSGRLGNLAPRFRFGQNKEPMSLDALASSKFTTFLERAMPVDAFAPQRNVGLRAHVSAPANRVTAWLGAYDVNAGRLGNADFGDGYALTGRLTGLPWAPPGHDGRFLHLGIAYSHRLDSQSVRFRTRAESGHTPTLVDTGTFSSDRQGILQGEIALQVDRVSLQSEYFWVRARKDTGEDLDYHGGYAQVSYFLTPPCRAFNRRSAVFERVHPCTTVREGGRGAWEVATRLSYVNLADAAQPGGTAWGVTFGVTWYMTPWVQLKANYVHSTVDDAHGVAGADGAVDTLAVRFQIDA